MQLANKDICNGRGFIKKYIYIILIFTNIQILIEFYSFVYNIIYPTRYSKKNIKGGFDYLTVQHCSILIIRRWDQTKLLILSGWPHKSKLIIQQVHIICIEIGAKPFCPFCPYHTGAAHINLQCSHQVESTVVKQNIKLSYYIHMYILLYQHSIHQHFQNNIRLQIMKLNTITGVVRFEKSNKC